MKFRTTFDFVEVFTNDKLDICATMEQNSTNHNATLPAGNIGCIEVSITNENPSIIRSMTYFLVHNVAHRYWPEIQNQI